MLPDLILEARAKRTADDGERDRDDDGSAVDLDGPDHVELGDRPSQLGIDDALERDQDIVVQAHAGC